jgi:hypothetical protein
VLVVGCGSGGGERRSAPTGLTVGGATATSVSLAWSAASDNVGVDGYAVFRNGSRVATTTGTSYTFAGLVCASSYTLAVATFDAAGDVSPRSSLRASTSACGGGVFYVSPAGSDGNPGTLAQPWRTLTKAIGALLPGQTAYVRAGVYQEQLSGSCGTAYNKLYWTRSGTANEPITIAGYPGEEKHVLVLTAITLAGDYQRLQRLVVDKNLGWSSSDQRCDGGPNVNLTGRNDSLEGVEVRNSAMSGVYLEGADGARLVGNWIHDNGGHFNHDHGVYWSSGASGLAADNIVQDNYANGVKIGPNAQSVLVAENTVDGNGRSGIIVSGDSTYTSNNNTIANDIVSWNGSSGSGFGIRTYWQTAGVGNGNEAVNNLVSGNTSGTSWYRAAGCASAARSARIRSTSCAPQETSTSCPAARQSTPPTPRLPSPLPTTAATGHRARARTSAPTSDESPIGPLPRRRRGLVAGVAALSAFLAVAKPFPATSHHRPVRADGSDLGGAGLRQGPQARCERQPVADVVGSTGETLIPWPGSPAGQYSISRSCGSGSESAPRLPGSRTRITVAAGRVKETQAFLFSVKYALPPPGTVTGMGGAAVII